MIDNSDSPKVSIIVPSYNRKKELNELLNSIILQDYSNFGIMVVLQGEDSSEDLLKNNFENVKYLKYAEGIGVSNAKNIGVLNTHGKYIWFLDSDCEVPLTDCLTNLVKLIEEEDTIGSIGGEIIELGDSLYLRVHRYILSAKKYSLDTVREQPNKFILLECDYLPTCNVLIRRKDLLKIGGFDETFIYGFEDAELGKKLKDLGYKNVLDYRTAVIHKRTQQVRLSNFNQLNLAQLRFVIINFPAHTLLLFPFFKFVNVVLDIFEMRNRSLNSVRATADTSSRYKMFGEYVWGILYGFIWNLRHIGNTLKHRKNRPDFLKNRIEE